MNDVRRPVNNRHGCFNFDERKWADPFVFNVAGNLGVILKCRDVFSELEFRHWDFAIGIFGI